MTDPNVTGQHPSFAEHHPADANRDDETERASSSHPNTDAQHASADVAPELFGW